MLFTLRVYEINLPNENFQLFCFFHRYAQCVLSLTDGVQNILPVAETTSSRETRERRLPNLKTHCWKNKNSKSRKSNGRTQTEGRQANEGNNGVAKAREGR